MILIWLGLSLLLGLKLHDLRGKLKPWCIMLYIYIYIPKLSHKDTVFKIESKEKGSFTKDMVNMIWYDRNNWVNMVK